MSPTDSQKKARQTKSQLPDLSNWPEIELREITGVANELLNRVSERDVEGIFTIPVIEAYPEIKDSYESLIEEPMDLRTIAEERIPAYNTIGLLQDDLILMYRNCCTFNEPGSVYWAYAKERWEELNDLFKEVCSEMGVLLPRRWVA